MTDPEAPLICPVCDRVCEADAWPTHPVTGSRRCPACHAAGLGPVAPRPLVGEEAERWRACEATGW